jgi:hypothetical protein
MTHVMPHLGAKARRSAGLFFNLKRLYLSSRMYADRQTARAGGGKLSPLSRVPSSRHGSPCAHAHNV